MLLLGKLCQAQMHNVWVLNGGGIDFNKSPTQVLPPPMYNSNEYMYASICDSTGKLRFYTNGKGVFNDDNEQIEQGFRLEQPETALLGDVSSILILPLPGSSTKYYLFHILRTNEFKGAGGILFYSVIDMAANAGKGNIIVKNKELFRERLVWVAGVKHENKKDFWLVINAGVDTFYSFPMTATGIGNKVQSHVTSSLAPLNGISSSLRASFDGKTLVGASVSSKLDASGYTYIEHYSSVNAYTFDNAKGIISTKKTLIENHVFNVNIGDSSIRTYEDATFSPNDSFIYICNGSGDKSTNLFQIERFAPDPRKTVIVIPYAYPIYTIQTAPDGYIYFPGYGKNYNIIKYPDRKGKACSLVHDHLLTKAWAYKFPSIFLEIHKLGFRFQTCVSTFDLTPQTDTAYFKIFDWFFPNGDSLSGKNITYTFGGKSGVYAIKLRGKSKYVAVNWFTDTIIYTAPPKALFSAESKTGCQWVGYQFTNQSNTDTIHPKKGESFLWDFGDGTTDTAKSPLHIFKKSGKFKVNLIYSNGFCSDTFIQQQNVEILAAPKPGFTINDTIGCVPFAVNVKDKSEAEVKKYTYNFGKQYESDQANPEFTFTKPGIYYITQKLLGTTGCITSDSVRIRVREGILPDEKPTMLYASFVNNNKVEISWKKHPLAKYYTLYKQDGNSVLQTIQKHFPDTVYVDNVISLKEPFHYFITVTDSCGNLSAPSQITKPIILQGDNIANNTFLLKYTAYENWQNGVKEYTVQYLPETDSFTEIINVLGLTATDTFRHQSKNSEQCYRIMAIENMGNGQYSHSNTICLPHVPVFYIPDAFSPNNDGLNDVFRISAIGVKVAGITIYNRWG